mgnify:CR=1 FL=1|tara:strand:+ start:1006 stop:1254 length:249 start_codon:yes stop_codon:yes gene_type:complete
MSEEENTPANTEIDTKDVEDILDFNTFTTLVKNLLLNPILLDESVDKRIIRFTKDLGEILVFFFKIILKLKDNAINCLKMAR